MPSSSCLFCRHANPPGAKFCNECGSPMHLRPCSNCEAVTDASAGTCHQCGAAFDAEGAPSIAAATAHAATDHARDIPETQGDGTPPSSRDSAARPRISVPGDADEDVPASSDLTRIAASDPSTHIPEWLAERFDVANRVGIARGPTPGAEGDSNASTGATSEEREDVPSRSLLAEYDARRPRRRLSPLLALAAVVLAAGAYYASFDVPRTVPVTTPAPAAPEPAAVPAPPAAHSDGNVSPAAVASPPSLPTAEPAEPPALTLPRAPRVQAERGPGAPSAASAQASRTTSDAERSVKRTGQRERDADETRRLIERDLGRFGPRPPERSVQ